MKFKAKTVGLCAFTLIGVIVCSLFTPVFTLACQCKEKANVYYDVRYYSMAFTKNGNYAKNQKGEFYVYKGKDGKKVKNTSYEAISDLKSINGWKGITVKKKIAGKKRTLLYPFKPLTEADMYNLLYNCYGGVVNPSVSQLRSKTPVTKRQFTEAINVVAGNLGVSLGTWDLSEPNAQANKAWAAMTLVNTFKFDYRLCPTSLRQRYYK